MAAKKANSTETKKRGRPKGPAKPKATKAKAAQAEPKQEAQAEPPKAPNNGRFKPGQSGNPNGRPKVVNEFKKIALEYVPDALKFLYDTMNADNKPVSARVTAAMALLDRGLGKPIQQLEVGKPGDFSDMDETEIDAFIAKASGELASLHAQGFAVH